MELLDVTKDINKIEIEELNCGPRQKKLKESMKQLGLNPANDNNSSSW